MTTDKERADKEKADKERHDKERHDKEREHENRDQDPKHPANKTLSPPPSTEPVNAALPPEAYMTEQEKEAMDTGVPSAKAPYPTGDPPPVHETVTRSQGIKGATDPKETPVDSSGPGAPMKKKGD